MSITAKTLINAKYASTSVESEYTAPANTRTIIDKFTATNTDGSAATISVYIVPASETQAAKHTILSAKSISSGACSDLTELQNQILNPGDKIDVVASIASKVVIRASGREVT